MRLRIIGPALLTVALAGLSTLGLASPAAAAESEITFTDGCGYVGVEYPYQGETVTVQRNGVPVAVFEDDSIIIGVSDGDTISVRVGDATPAEHLYQAPEGCTGPDISFSFTDGCQSLVLLKANNKGTAVATGFTVSIEDYDEPVEFPTGASTSAHFAAPGETIVVRSRVEGVAVVWAIHTYTEPRKCGPATLAVSFADSCAKVSATVTSQHPSPQFYLVFKNIETPDWELVDLVIVASDAPAVTEMPAVDGDEMSLYYPLMEGATAAAMRSALKAAVDGKQTSGFSKLAEDFPGWELLGAHEYATPEDCGGGGGGLPVTGFPAGLAVAGGALLLVAGAGLYLMARRRAIAG